MISPINNTNRPIFKGAVNIYTYEKAGKAVLLETFKTSKSQDMAVKTLANSIAKNQVWGKKLNNQQAVSFTELIERIAGVRLKKTQQEKKIFNNCDKSIIFADKNPNKGGVLVDYYFNAKEAFQNFFAKIDS